MSIIIMLVIGALGISFVLSYFIGAYRYKKRGKDKKAISEKLVELLKE